MRDPPATQTKRKVIFAIGFVLACSGFIYGYARATDPLSYPIFLEPAGSSRHEQSERHVCAMWLGHPEWLIAVENGSSLYSEIRSARSLQFELDVGSGLSDVCVSEEFDAQTRRDVVKAVLKSCGGGGWHARPDTERQVVLHLQQYTNSAAGPLCRCGLQAEADQGAGRLAVQQTTLGRRTWRPGP